MVFEVLFFAPEDVDLVAEAKAGAGIRLEEPHALDAGYSLAAISECLGVGPSSLRGRAESGRELSLDAMQALGLDPGVLQEMGHPRIFGSPRKHHDGQRYYSAAAILRGLGILQ